MKLTRAALLLIGVAILRPDFSAAQQAAKEDDPVAMVRMYGPGGDLLDSQTIAIAEEMLKWQRVLVERQLEHLQKLRDSWSARLEEVNAAIQKAESEISSSGLPAMFDSGSLSQLAQKLVDAEVQLSALHAKRSALERVMAETKQEFEQSVRQIGATERQHLQDLVAAANDEFENAKKLHDSGHIPFSELREAELKLSELKFRIQKLELETSRKPQEMAGLDQDLLNLVSQIEYQEKMVFDLKAKFESARSPVNQVAGLIRQRQFCERNIEQLEQEIFSIHVKEAGSEALLELIENASDETPDAKDDK